MYLTLLLFSVTAYALQNVLIGHLARRYDLLWITTARGLCLGLLMAPLLFLAAAEGWARLPHYLPYLALACVCALLANLSQTFAVRHLHMAIAVAIGQALAALFTLIIEVLLGEGLPPLSQIACVAGVIGGVVVLGWVSSKGQVLAPSAKPWYGIFACVSFGLFMASALIPLGMLSRRVDPFIAAWSWEAGIGVVGLLAVSSRAAIWRTPAISWRIALRVGICASPTVIGTGCYTLATTMGSISIAGGVLSAMMVATAIIARILYREFLSALQWAAIAATCACLVALGVVQWWQG